MQPWHDAKRRGAGFLASYPSQIGDAVKIVSRHHATFLLLLPGKNHTCYAETVADTLSFSLVVREASQSLFLPPDSCTGLLSFILLFNLRENLVCTYVDVYTAIHTILNYGQQGPGVHLPGQWRYCVLSQFKTNRLISGRLNRPQPHHVKKIILCFYTHQVAIGLNVKEKIKRSGLRRLKMINHFQTNKAK